MKKQIIVIHGGMTFDTYDDYLNFLKTAEFGLEYLKKKSWRDSLQEKLGDDFDVVKMQMPSALNAKYLEWKIYFERYIPFFNEEVVLVGHSLGGIFLAKYLSENKYSKKIRSVYLIAAPHTDVKIEESLGDFMLPESIEKMSDQVGKIFIIFSEDDMLVTVPHAERYMEQLPKAEVIKFTDKQHFSLPEFGELVDHIKVHA